MIYHFDILQKLESSFNLTGTQAASANIYTLDFAFYNGTYALDIWLPGALGLQMGMADIVTGQLTLTAYFT
jgi:hypothetical protein